MARKFYIESKESFNIGQEILVEGDEFLHISRVMQKKVGDEIIVINGSGYDYNCLIKTIDKKSLILKITNCNICPTETKSNIALFQALVKGDKFELIMQKITELGVKKLVPFSSTFCQVKPNTTRLDRLEKISIEALKQCGRATKVEIESILSFNQMLESLKTYDKVIFAYENATNNLDKNSLTINGKLAENVAIIVGSEGGFNESETEQISKLNNAVTISLGKRILRAETAAISLTSVIMFLLNEWSL